MKSFLAQDERVMSKNTLAAPSQPEEEVAKRSVSCTCTKEALREAMRYAWVPRGAMNWRLLSRHSTNSINHTAKKAQGLRSQRLSEEPLDPQAGWGRESPPVYSFLPPNMFFWILLEQPEHRCLSPYGTAPVCLSTCLNRGKFISFKEEIVLLPFNRLL